MTWGAQEYLWGLLLLIPFVWMCRGYLQQRSAAWMVLGIIAKPRHWFYSFWCTGCGIFCVVLSLAQPRLGFQEITIEKEQRDIVVVLDISRSMLAEDVLPSRIERAHWELRSLVDYLEGDRIALVTFAKRSYVRMPLSKEYSIFLDLMNESHPEQIRIQGSDIANALLVASDLFVEEKGSIVLVSDGEDHSERLTSVAQQLSQKKISVYSLAIGTESGGTMPYGGAGFFTDENGEKVISRRMDEALLQLSTSTGGLFAVSQPGTADWDILYKKGIQKQASRSLSLEEETIWNELFMWPLGLGLLFFLGVYGVRVRGSSLLLSLFFCVRTGYAEPLLDVRNMNSVEDYAIALYQQGAYAQAERIFEELIVIAEVSSSRDRARYNAALCSYELGKLEEALAQLRSMKSSTEASRYNAVQIEQEIAKRRRQEPEEKPQKQQKNSQKGAQGSDSAQQNQENSDASAQSNPPSEAQTEQERNGDNSSQKQDSRQNEQSSSSQNSSDEQEGQGQPQQKEHTTGPSRLQELDSMSSSTQEPSEQESGQNPLPRTPEEQQQQEAERLLDSVLEGKNRGLGAEEEFSSGKKAW